MKHTFFLNAVFVSVITTGTRWVKLLGATINVRGGNGGYYK